MKNVYINCSRFARSCVLLTSLIVGGTALGELRLPGIFGHHMVLQRDMPVPVWGWAVPGAEVTVSFGDQSASAIADDRGSWRVRLAAMPASGEDRALRVVASTPTNAAIVLTNVVVGEVWLCSGQSNMEWIMRQITNAAAEIAASHDPLLRHVKIEQRKSDFPLEDGPNRGWQPSSPFTAGEFTAVGTFFARALREELDVPVGLIGANWGGSRIEPWTSAEGFRGFPELEAFRKVVDQTWIDTDEGMAAYDEAIRRFQAWLPIAESAVAARTRPPVPPVMPSLGPTEPTSMFNAMIHPLVPFALRGAIWYQGESNTGDPNYGVKMAALIDSWREAWGQESFPFYFVQLTSYQADNRTPAGGGHFCLVRELQRKALEIPETGMAVTIDIGDPKDIHPRNKQDVGDRLARWALHRDYGRTHIVPSGPLYAGHATEGSAIRVSFDHVGSGLMVGQKVDLDPVEERADAKLDRFAIAGADMNWFWADAEIDGDTILLSSPHVPAPLHVQYAYSASPMGVLLYNRDGLPASPFKAEANRDAQDAQPARIKVACVGDSITQGSGIEDWARNGYPAQLGRLLGEGWDVRNFGRAAATLVARGDLPYHRTPQCAEALAFEPDVVVIKLGTNDTKPNNLQYVSDFTTDYMALIESFKALPSQPEVWIGYPVPVNQDMWGISNAPIVELLIPGMNEVARRTGAGIIDLHSALSGRPELFADPIHPNVEGAGLIAKVVAEHLQKDAGTP